MEGVEDITWKYRPNITKDGKIIQGPDTLCKDLQCILISVGFGSHEYLLDSDELVEKNKDKPSGKKLTQMKLMDKKQGAFKGIDIKDLMKL